MWNSKISTEEFDSCDHSAYLSSNARALILQHVVSSSFIGMLLGWDGVEETSFVTLSFRRYLMLD